MVDFIYEHTQDTTSLVMQVLTEEHTYFIDALSSNVRVLVVCLPVAVIIILLVIENIIGNSENPSEPMVQIVSVFGNMFAQGT